MRLFVTSLFLFLMASACKPSRNEDSLTKDITIQDTKSGAITILKGDTVKFSVNAHEFVGNVEKKNKWKKETLGDKTRFSLRLSSKNNSNFQCEYTTAGFFDEAQCLLRLDRNEGAEPAVSGVPCQPVDSKTGRPLPNQDSNLKRCDRRTIEVIDEGQRVYANTIAFTGEEAKILFESMTFFGHRGSASMMPGGSFSKTLTFSYNNWLRCGEINQSEVIECQIDVESKDGF